MRLAASFPNELQDKSLAVILIGNSFQPHFSGRPMNQSESIDWDQALTTVGGDSEMLSELCGVYIAEAKEMVSKMRSALASGDRQLLRRSAHTLKGASMSMAATKTKEEADLLEQGCESMDEQTLGEHLSRVEDAVQAAVDAIENHTAAGKTEH